LKAQPAYWIDLDSSLCNGASQEERFCEETGFTGLDLLNAEQQYFSYPGRVLQIGRRASGQSSPSPISQTPFGRAGW
jgi:hypothetical protein